MFKHLKNKINCLLDKHSWVSKLDNIPTIVEGKIVFKYQCAYTYCEFCKKLLLLDEVKAKWMKTS